MKKNYNARRDGKQFCRAAVKWAFSSLASAHSHVGCSIFAISIKRNITSPIFYVIYFM